MSFPSLSFGRNMPVKRIVNRLPTALDRSLSEDNRQDEVVHHRLKF